MALLKVITDTKEQRKERFKAIGVQFFFNLAPTILFLGAIAVFFVFNPFEALNKWSPIKTLSNHNPLSDPHSVLAKVLVPIIIFFIIAILMSTCRYIVNTSDFCERNNKIRPLDIAFFESFILYYIIDRYKDPVSKYNLSHYTICYYEDCGISMCCLSDSNPDIYQMGLAQNTPYYPDSFDKHDKQNKRWLNVINLIISIIMIPVKLVLAVLRLIVNAVNLVESPLTVPIHTACSSNHNTTRCGIAKQEFLRMIVESILNAINLVTFPVLDYKSHMDKIFPPSKEGSCKSITNSISCEDDTVASTGYDSAINASTTTPLSKEDSLYINK